MISVPRWLGDGERAVAALGTLVVLSMGAAMLFHGGALWRDEVNSLVVASQPSLVSMWRMFEFESFPALWPLLLAGWSRAVGDGDLVLRLFGVLGGVSLPAAIWFATKRLGRSWPLVSLAVVAVNPEIIRWGFSVRAWGLGAALAVLALVFVWEAVERPSWQTSARAILIAILAVQCAYQNVFFVFAFVSAATVSGLLSNTPRVAVRPLAAGFAAALSLLPYIGTLQRVGDWSMLNQVPLTSSVVLARLFHVTFPSGSVALACWVGVTAVAVTLTIRRAVVSKRRRAEDPGTLANYLMMAAGIAAAALITLYTTARYPPYSWYYLGLIAVVAVCSEVAIRSLTQTAGSRVAMATAALTVLLVGLPSAWSAVHQPLSNLDAIGARLTAETRAEDLVIANPWLYGISLKRYYRGAAPLVTVPDLADFSVHRFDLLKQKMVQPASTPLLLGRIEATLRSGARVWVIGDDPVSAALKEAPPRLPPPPLPNTGWSVRPYILAWGGEIGVVLGQHAVHGERINPEVLAQPLENAQLLVFRGWQDRPASGGALPWDRNEPSSGFPRPLSLE